MFSILRILSLLWLILAALATGGSANSPVQLIIDTDLGFDVDGETADLCMCTFAMVRENLVI